MKNIKALLPVLRTDDLHVVALEHACEREDVAHVVVHDQDLLAREPRLLFVNLLEHLAPWLVEFRLYLMREQRDFIEQTLRRALLLDDDGLHDLAQSALFFFCQLLSSIDDDRRA